MIGYYVHHHGKGHLTRARAIAAHLAEPVTILSSLPRDPDWAGDWVELPLDVSPPHDDPTAAGRLHWAPLGVPGLRARMAAIASWLERAGPRLVVVDVSAEVAVLVRLHGVPVVSIALPGVRDDAPHALGFGVSSALVAAWPAWADGMITGLPGDAADRVHAVGAISRRAPAGDEAPPRSRHVVVLTGAGGDTLTESALAAARAETPEWTWTRLGGPGTWVDDPSELLRSAAVVVTTAGQNAIADVAAARRPALVLPQERPFHEQRTTAEVLARAGLPVTVRGGWPETGWPELLTATAYLDGTRWQRWNDGAGAQRAAAVIAEAVP